ncbi:unnamed protein product [Malus baccata var. baccata]
MQTQCCSVSVPVKSCLVRTPSTSPSSRGGGTAVDSIPMIAAGGPKWAQKTITLPPLKRGCHLVTPKIVKEIGEELSEFNCGLAHLFLQHTSASLTINENYDSDVRDDTETFLNTIVPEGTSAPWKHTLEGWYFDSIAVIQSTASISSSAEYFVFLCLNPNCYKHVTSLATSLSLH